MYWGRTGIEKKLAMFFGILCGVVFFTLFIFSFFFSWVNAEFWTEFVSQRMDSKIGNLLGILLALFLLYLITKISGRFAAGWNMDRIAICISLLCMSVSIWWVTVGKAAPLADQAYLISYADAFDSGDTSGLARGQYVGIYQQQLGLITWLRILFRIFGKRDYRIFQYFSAIMVFLLVFSGYQVVKRLTENNKKSEMIYFIFMLLCVPMYGYASFVYGEICSTATIFLGAWMLLSCIEELKIWKLIVLMMAVAFSILMRKNTLVPLIGFLIVVAIKMFCRPSRHTMYIGAALIGGMLLSQATIHAVYGRDIPEDSKSVPAILFIAMGTHDQREGAPGWHDNYDVDLYKEMNWDPTAARKAAYKDLKSFIKKCVANPAYAVSFYTEKMNTQWNAPMYQCLVMNNYINGEWTLFIQSVHAGKISIVLEKFMNIYQLLLYGGVLFLLLEKWKKWDKIENYVLLIGVYGGFLFSLLWEAKTRYVFPYMLMMLPYAAIGISCFLEKASEWVNRLKKNKKLPSF